MMLSVQHHLARSAPWNPKALFRNLRACQCQGFRRWNASGHISGSWSTLQSHRTRGPLGSFETEEETICPGSLRQLGMEGGDGRVSASPGASANDPPSAASGALGHIMEGGQGGRAGHHKALALVHLCHQLTE